MFHVEQGLSIQHAAETVMSELCQKTCGEAGLILVDRSGDIAIQFETPHMPVAVLSGEMKDVYCSMTPEWPIE